MATGTAISPNQDSKRQQIIEAARVVLARDGLAGCTARAVADASPLTKSAINYYFASMDEIIDLAVAAHVEAMLAALRAVAARERDPYQRLHAVLRAYLDTFADQPHAAYLWFEYWIAAARRGATVPAEAMLAAVRELLTELLAGLRAAAGRPADPALAASALLSWLLGTLVQQQVGPLPSATVRAEADRVLGLG
ncbi:MAG TPA: TetR family transcriptional regulator [Streptosporangiaceae bacterium]|nr:TetR family transcriptional regulator [Streptosporangiaceae bacterium]